MGYASKSGRARTSSRNPQAFGVCDRCGIWHNHNRLSWQYDWRGASLMNTRILVCNTCLDTPQQQLRSIVVPADPTPIQNPRTEAFYQNETNIRQTSLPGGPPFGWINDSLGLNGWTNNAGAVTLWVEGTGYNVDPNTGIPVPIGNTRITQNNDTRVTQQTGEPPGGLNQLPGTDWAVPAVIYDGTEIGLPWGTTVVPFTGPLYPPYNYSVQWNNVWNFGIRTGDYWSNNTGAFVTWNTTVL